MSIGQKLWSPSYSQICMAAGCVRFARINTKFYRSLFSDRKVMNGEKGNSREHVCAVAVVGCITFVRRSRIAVAFAKPEIAVAPLSSAESLCFDVQGQRLAIGPLCSAVAV